MRKHNFSAGPSALPEAVLTRAQGELLDWHGTGLSIMEMSHRSAEFVSVAEKAEQDLRSLMNIPSNYKVLFVQGGATSQFSMVPLNLLGDKTKADYINTGIWSGKAIKEAQRYCTVNVASSSEETNFTSVPSQDELKLDPEAAYVHYTPNETIGGVEFDYIPDTGDVPLVADFSSSILSYEIDVSKFALIYAGAQKNIGPAGLTLVIVREDMLGKCAASAPSMYDYSKTAAADSMLNTPPTLAWYLSGLVFEWLQEQGGVAAVEKINAEKAALLYNYLDESDFFANPVAVNARSKMNVPFTLKNTDLEKTFLKEAEAAGLLNLKGHRSVGGMRASIYNAVPLSSVEALVDFLKTFEKTHG
ncbi:MAG: 3-phosphoserine/phosphohydroxythreonine transaminase [Pontibacterium sp.]